MDQVDLHIHTNKSDGTASIEKIIDQALRFKLRAIAITDHDTVEEIPKAIKIGKEKSLEIIPGIELSAEKETGEDFHILGYFIDYQNENLLHQLGLMQQARKERIFKICKKLTTLGKKILAEEIFSLAPNSHSFSRMHVAQALLLKKYVKNIREAFDKFLSPKKPCYVRKFKFSPGQAIQMIVDASGIPVLAHPCVYDTEKFIPELVKQGLLGLEVYHPEHKENQVRKLKCMAEQYRLFSCGGSDYHGSYKKKILLGTATTSYQIVEAMKQYLQIK